MHRRGVLERSGWVSNLRGIQKEADANRPNRGGGGFYPSIRTDAPDVKYGGMTYTGWERDESEGRGPGRQGDGKRGSAGESVGQIEWKPSN